MHPKPHYTPLDAQAINRNGLVSEAIVLSNGQPLYCFVDNHIELIKLDFTFEAGSALQSKPLVANAMLNLITEGTRHHSANEIAEFIDRRGILVDRQVDTVSATLTFYTLKRHLSELLPLILEMFEEPLFDQSEFDLYIAKRRNYFLTLKKKTSFVARSESESRLFGANHPIGSVACEEDFDRIGLEDIKNFFADYVHLNEAHLMMAGNITPSVIEEYDRVFGKEHFSAPKRIILPAIEQHSATGYHHFPVEGAVQTTLRVSRVLPFSWNSDDYADFMVLSTILGGYFGSRLMSNIREEKGYTYGINSMTKIFRGFLVFNIISDVASDKADAALKEIEYEMNLLCNEDVCEEEMELVRNCMLGDFIRSIDGVFEKSERYKYQYINGIDESFTNKYLQVLSLSKDDMTQTNGGLMPITKERIRQSAQRFFCIENYLEVAAG